VSLESNPRVFFDTAEAAWEGFPGLILNLIRKGSFFRVCEAGGGANPLFSPKEARDHGFTYCLLDISERELAKNPGYHWKIMADLASPDFSVTDRFDLVFSRMLVEHISRPAIFHGNIRKILRPGGMAVHFFPTLFAWPFLVNWMLPETASFQVLQWLSPRDQELFGKFPAYYRWCRGPMTSQFRRFRRIGFELLEYHGFFGHRQYYRKWSGIQKCHDYLRQVLLHHPVPELTSFAYVVLRRPPGSPDKGLYS
jgi:SAM-dependent methyltransferase